MGNELVLTEASRIGSRLAGGLSFIDDTSVREPAFANQLDSFDSHGIEWTSRVRKRAATGVALLTFAGPYRS